MKSSRPNRLRNSVVILCDGAFPTTPYPLYLLEHADVAVCCDGALEKWLEHFGEGRLPDVVIGDMDSLGDALLEKFADRIVRIDEQEHNDMTKAMRYCLAHFPEAEEIHILGATGLREDHTLGNLGLLMDYPRQFDLGGRKVDMVSDYGTAFAVTDSCELHVGEGRRVSIFSADNSLKICSDGLHWPTDEVVFDAWWKATLNRADKDVITLRFSHPSTALVILD